MLGGRCSMLGRRIFRCSPEKDGCRRTWIDAGGPFTLFSFVVMRHLSLSAGSFSLFAGTHPGGYSGLALQGLSGLWHSRNSLAMLWRWASLSSETLCR